MIYSHYEKYLNICDLITNNKITKKNEYLIYDALKYTPSLIRHYKYPTVNICNFVININAFNLKYIKNQPYNSCVLAVTKCGMALKYVLHVDDNLKKIAYKL